MDKFKEFQARDLDQAILDACEYFAVPREKLEIEIIQDAKTGIFGIVGARKAKIRARRAHLQETVEQLLGRSDSAAPLNDGRGRPRRKKGARQSGEDDMPADSTEVDFSSRRQAEGTPQRRPNVLKRSTENIHARSQDALAEIHNAQDLEKEPDKSRNQVRLEKIPNQDAEVDFRSEIDPDDSELTDSWPQTPVEELDQETLRSTTQDVVGRLIRPIVGENVRVEVDMDGSRILASIHDIQDSGLLIGREGQTLTAIQYLASRMISKAMNAGVRIKLDAGEYRQKQDEKVREMAQILAQKALKTGRSYSTRPLSSYHRRLVHLSLQDMPEIQTRSTGEGSLKRVVIMRRKAERPQ